MTDHRLLLLLCLWLPLPAGAADTPASAAGASTAVTSDMPVPERSQPDPTASLRQTLKNQPPHDSQLVELKAGTSSLLAFYQPAEQPNPLGGVILFPDQSTHPDWPEHTRSLRRGLAQHGWHTLALYLPPPAPMPLPVRTLPVLTEITSGAAASPPASTARPATSPVTDSTTKQAAPATEQPSAYPEQMKQYADAAINHMQTLGIQRILLLGVGSGATWAAEAMVRLQNRPDLRLVMLDARQSTAAEAPKLMQLLPAITATTIDLYHPATSTPPASEDSPAQRLTMVNRLGLSQYHQRRLPFQVSAEASDDRLLKEMRGALQSLIIKPEQRRGPPEAPAPKKQQAAPGTPS